MLSILQNKYLFRLWKDVHCLVLFALKSQAGCFGQLGWELPWRRLQQGKRCLRRAALWRKSGRVGSFGKACFPMRSHSVFLLQLIPKDSGVHPASSSHATGRPCLLEWVKRVLQRSDCSGAGRGVGGPGDDSVWVAPSCPAAGLLDPVQMLGATSG